MCIFWILGKEVAQPIADEIIAPGCVARVYQCDVSNQEQVLDIFAQIGRVDILVNNAGIAHVGRVDNTTTEDMDKIYSVNVKGAYNALYVAIPLMRKQGGGVIVNMVSISSSVGVTDRFAYSMSKGAIVGMTLFVARDYLQHHIQCNCISPARGTHTLCRWVYRKELSWQGR